MKAAGAAGNIIQAMGGGTDQQTKMDKWMDSALFSWNIGMLNGFAGKKSDSFSIDDNLAEKVGSSYGGALSEFADLEKKANKEYGLFSSAARKKTNKLIAEATKQQNKMLDISNTAELQRLNAQYMGEQSGLAYQTLMDGGYNQKYTYAAKYGGVLDQNIPEQLEWEPQIELNWELPEFQEGGSIELREELEWIPELQKGGKTELDTAATLKDWWKGTWSYLSGNLDDGLIESKYRPSNSTDENVKYYYRKGLNNDVIKNIIVLFFILNYMQNGQLIHIK